MNRQRTAFVGAVAVLIVVAAVAGIPIIKYEVQFQAAPGSPSAAIEGYSTALYRLAGIGAGPYPATKMVSLGNSSALVHFRGSEMTYWEGPFPADTALNPSGVVSVGNVTMTQWAFGLLNFTAQVTNLGDRPVVNLTVDFRYPTYGMNITTGSSTRYLGPEAPCSALLQPKESCTVVVSLPQSTSLLTGNVYPMDVEARSPGGPVGPYESASPFIFIRTFQVVYQGSSLGPAWVQEFIQAVNERRNSTSLTENRTLDEFAAYRYDSIRAEYQISDFNFTQDLTRYFGSGAYSVSEEILYPQDFTPSGFLTYLHQTAPGHWSGLMYPTYKQFGYFFGTGPSIVIGPGCPAKEIPGPNINITRYVIAHGCDYVIADQVWLIIILGT